MLVEKLLMSERGLDTTFITPCMALLPYLALAGPLITSREDALSVRVSNNPLTLQNPLGRTGMLSSNIRKDPQAPGPVKTGDLMEVKCSCPDPLLIHTPGTLLKICLGC